jgi:hypothetical protein
MAEIDPDVMLPECRDWERPEPTEVAVDAARAELQQARSDGDTPSGDAGPVQAEPGCAMEDPVQVPGKTGRWFRRSR